MEPRGERSDGELAISIAAGDERAFMEVYDAHGSVLFGVVARLLGDRDAAAEVVQEVFVTLWQRAARYEPAMGSLRTWLLRIARNRAVDRYRMETRRPRAIPMGDRGADDGAPGPGRYASEVATATDDPGTSLERRWIQAVVRAAVASMPGDERAVLVLAYDEGLSQSQIAVRLGLPIGTVKSRTRRGMSRLREMLGTIPDLGDVDVMEARRGSR